jgi:pimeloyl-ACP methyl ester carboxylesterase
VFYDKGGTRIYYEEAGTGFPLMLLPGGGLNSTVAGLKRGNPFDAIGDFKDEYRCITADLRNAPSGESTGPVEVDRPWDSYADDHLGLMDHLGIDKFAVMGFCIGGPFIWSLLKRAPNRVAAAVIAQPVGWRPEMRDRTYPGAFWAGWPAQITAKRPEILLQTAEQFVVRMFVMPDEVPAHPSAVAIESAMLAPNAEMSIFPWKEPKERIPLAVRQIRSFLRAHRSA